MIWKLVLHSVLALVYVFSYIPNLFAEGKTTVTNLYLAYFYNFAIGDKPQRIIFNLSYGVDDVENYGNKYIFTAWFSWKSYFLRKKFLKQKKA